MKLIHYQTLEAVDPEELQALRIVKEQFNERRSFWERIKLWEKSDILAELEPKGARWGFTRVRDDRDRLQVVLTLRRMSQATPRLTWVLYDECNGGKEVVLRGGNPVA
ncbi:MAG: hypothetical protein QMD00_01000 [Hadesarchaea archaeon]|nr:hypothetical protein [Hadesarchaea archaeon]